MRCQICYAWDGKRQHIEDKCFIKFQMDRVSDCDFLKGIVFFVGARHRSVSGMGYSEAMKSSRLETCTKNESINVTPIDDMYVLDSGYISRDGHY